MSKIYLIVFILNAYSFRLPLMQNLHVPSPDINDPFMIPRHYISLNISGKTFNFGLDFSTGSSFLFSRSCGCTNSSTLIENLPKHSQPKTKNLLTNSIKYQDRDLKGVYYSFNISGDPYMYPMNFLIVKESSAPLSGLALDGIIGLGFIDTNEDRLSFSEQLEEYERTSNYGIVLESYYNTSIESSVEFGHSSVQEFFLGKKRRKLLRDDFSTWELITTRFIYGNREVVSEFVSEFDVNIQTIKVPKSIFPSVKQAFQSQLGNMTANLEFSCEESLIPSLASVIFKIQRSKFPLRPKNFIVYENGACKVLFEKNTEEKWVLGEPFFKDYFISFGYSNRDINFYQIDEFIIGFYETGIIGFIFLMFFVSGCFAWCLTGKIYDEEVKFTSVEKNNSRDKSEDNQGKGEKDQPLLDSDKKEI